MTRLRLVLVNGQVSLEVANVAIMGGTLLMMIGGFIFYTLTYEAKLLLFFCTTA